MLGLPNTVAVPPVIAGETEEWQRLRTHETTTIGAGAAGCFLAHRSIWIRSASVDARIEGASIMLVLERDARLTRYGRRWLAPVIKWFGSSGVDILNLGSFGPELAWINSRSPSAVAASWIRVVRYQSRKALRPVTLPSFGHRTHAYLIKRSFAMRLAQTSYDFGLPVDAWLLKRSHSVGSVGRHVAPRLFTTFPMASEVDTRGR